MEQDDIARKAKADADAAALAEATKFNRIKVEALKTIDGGDVGGATLLCNDLGIIMRRAKEAQDALKTEPNSFMWHHKIAESVENAKSSRPYCAALLEHGLGWRIDASTAAILNADAPNAPPVASARALVPAAVTVAPAPVAAAPAPVAVAPAPVSVVPTAPVAVKRVGLTCTITDIRANSLTYEFGGVFGGMINETGFSKNGSAVTVAGKQPTWSYAANDTNDVVIKSLAAPGWMIVIDQNDKADLIHGSNIVGSGSCRRAA